MAFRQAYSESSAENKTLFAGSVITKNNSGWRVLTEQGEFILAQLAASCFTEPQKGSEVILGATSTGYYILTVLTYPAKILKFEAQTVHISSEHLLLENKATEIKTSQLRFDARRIICFAKKMYSKVGQLFQKADAFYVESEHYKIKVETLSEEVSSLRFVKAGTMSEKADVISTQADKVLIN